ncbi:hypothetical protein PRIPAC_86744 [Pristionchus pacificus]|uniref:Sulfotransferase family cytosolic 1B member 1 n=1 Tax=Pristionchus pacificus TaxID=54126 RepID=A0A2A6CC62_PRIPA|nr:hypothetical protein PRIPAC_86744 [Pristionchus pacificus]|eukprot:PDM75764.1 hypothetical protein PRIPAC_40143 [Pristionchus pacificus]
MVSAKMIDASDEWKKRYVSRIPHSFEYAGYTWAGMATNADKIISLKDRQFGPDDVVIASYPKSGTTWASEVLSAIAHEGDINLIRTVKINDRVPWIESDDSSLAANFPGLSSLRKRVVTSAKKKIYSTHLPLHLLPPSILRGDCKLLYVARNPKDLAVSYFHFHQMAKFLGLQNEMTWDEFMSLFCTGSLWYGDWFEHVISYWKFSQNNPQVKFICYEDMKIDLMREMESLEELVGISLSMEQRKEVVNHSSFDSMKCNKMTNREGNMLLDQSRARFMRKGIVGDWKNYFTVAQSEAFDELYQKEMKGSGLNFQFE